MMTSLQVVCDLGIIEVEQEVPKKGDKVFQFTSDYLPLNKVTTVVRATYKQGQWWITTDHDTSESFPFGNIWCLRLKNQQL